MIAHVALRKTHTGGGHWIHAHGWVIGRATGAGLATSRAEAIRKACIEAVSVGAKIIALPAARDWAAALQLDPPPGWDPPRPRTHEDPAAVAVALRAASVELMRECIRRYGMPDLGMLRARGTRDVKWTAAQAVVEQLGGPETVAAVLGCDAAQVVRWSRRGWPDVRIKALKREVSWTVDD